MAKADDIKAAVELYMRLGFTATGQFMSMGKNASALISLVRNLQTTTDAIESEYWRMVGSAPFRKECRPGCAWCCYTQVIVSVPELACIWWQIAGNPKRNKLRTEALCKQVLQIDNVTHKMMAEERYKSGLPCPLLVENKCGVYADRPWTCRAVHSIYAELCEYAYTNRLVVTIPHQGITGIVTRATAQGMIMALLQMGVEFAAQVVELAAGLRVAIEHPRAFDYWLAGYDSFSTAVVDVSAGQLEEIESVEQSMMQGGMRAADMPHLPEPFMSRFIELDRQTQEWERIKLQETPPR
jgi:hypothetical protein